MKRSDRRPKAFLHYIHSTALRRPRTRRAARIAASGRTAPLARWRALDCRCEWQDVGPWQVEEYASQFLNSNTWAHDMCPLPWQCKHLTGSVSKCPCRACAHHQAPAHPVPIKCAYAPTVASVLVSSCALARRYRASTDCPFLLLLLLLLRGRAQGPSRSLR